MTTRQTSKPSLNERTGIDRLYKRIGVRKISFFYQHSDGSRETLATALKGDREATALAERKAKRLALDIREGQVLAGSMTEVIERFEEDIAPKHFRDQSKDGLAVRKSAYENLKKFFGRMAPMSIKTLHGYQFLDARALSGAPKKANKELSLMSTIANYAVRWGVMESNPFVGMMQNKADKDVRVIERRQVLRFYLWSLKQPVTFRNMGCAAMFTYLTGFRTAEVRPFRVSGLSKDGVRVLSAKRKMGEIEVMKLRDWSIRLHTVVERAKRTHKVDRIYLFATSTGDPYTRSGWGSCWQDAMFEWIASIDTDAAVALGAKREWEARRRKDRKIGKFVSDYKLVKSEHYFSLMDIRPAAITTKLRKREADAYDFAAHANPATTHKHYDRRREKKAGATE